MRRKIKAIMRLGRRKGRHILDKMFGADCMSSGFISPEMHDNLYRASQSQKDARP